MLDAGLLEGAPPHLSERARASSARPPLDFRLFHQSKRSDWYVLILDGHGTFASGVQGHLVEDGQPMLQELHEGRAAPTPGSMLGMCVRGSWHTRTLRIGPSPRAAPSVRTAGLAVDIAPCAESSGELEDLHAGLATLRERIAQHQA